MIDLLNKYSISDILIFLVMFALALKGCLTFLDWSKERMRQLVRQEERPQRIQGRVETIQNRQEAMDNTLHTISDKLDLLIQSDRDDIKAYITQKHHYYVYERHWVDDYTMNVIEKRYMHYKTQGGNSFIRGLMDELRALPKQPKARREKLANVKMQQEKDKNNKEVQGEA